MFERLLAFLKELPGGGPGGGTPDPSDDPRVAAAALLYHVMAADGVSRESERAALRTALAGSYDITGEALDRLARAGQEADDEAVDLYAFTSVLKRSLDEEGRRAFIGLMWDVVFADGELHELEDHILWRVAELIGVDGRDRIALRQAARKRAPAAQDRITG